MTLTELNQKRGELIAEARKINDLAKNEKRDMSAQESERFDKLMGESDDLDKQREALLKDQKRSDWLEAQDKSAGRKADPDDASNKGGKVKDEVRAMKWGDDYTTPREIKLASARATDEYRSAFSRYLSHGTQSEALAAGYLSDEEGALQADADTIGGYIVTPVQMVAELIKFLDNAVFVRQKATVYQVPNAQSLGGPSLDTDMAAPVWTSELGTGDEDSSLAFGRRELHPHPLAKRIKVSNTLMRKAMMGPEALIRDRLGYQMAITQEAAFLTGDGSSQPLGLFTASNNGIPTSQDVSTDNTTTAITADGLINAKYSLKQQHQAEGEWIFHRTAVRNIRKLKDGNGQYIWQPGLVGDARNTLLERPVNQSEYAPSTFTTGQYVGLFGNMRFYWIADSLSMTVQRLVELYAATNQTGFIGRLECDGAPVLAEAFARVKLA